MRRRRVRVLYYHYSQHFDTGSPRSLATLIDTLSRIQYEPLFWASGEGPLVAELEKRGVGIVRGPVRSVSYRRPYTALRTIVEKAATLRRLKIDLLHLNDFGWNFDLALGAALARVPIIVHARTPIGSGPRNLNLHPAHKLIFISHDFLDATPLPERLRRKSVVLYNAVDLGKCGAGTSIRPQLGLDDSHVVIGTIAQISQRKGIDTLLDVARALVGGHGNLYFLVIGPPGVGEEAFAKAMLAASEEPALHGRVRFLGTRSDIPDLLASMDIFFFPTRGEPFGRVVIEAMAAGVPVVASRIGGVPEIITSPELGSLVAPDDVAGFVDALSLLIDRSDLRAALATRARESLIGRFDLATHGRRVDDIYCEVLGRRAAASA